MPRTAEALQTALKAYAERLFSTTGFFLTPEGHLASGSDEAAFLHWVQHGTIPMGSRVEWSFYEDPESAAAHAEKSADDPNRVYSDEDGTLPANAIGGEQWVTVMHKYESKIATADGLCLHLDDMLIDLYILSHGTLLTRRQL